jgi:hypothetical protein
MTRDERRSYLVVDGDPVAEHAEESEVAALDEGVQVACCQQNVVICAQNSNHQHTVSACARPGARTGTTDIAGRRAAEEALRVSERMSP